MFGALADADINIHMISTSDIKISCLVRWDELKRQYRPFTNGSVWAAPFRDLIKQKLKIKGASLGARLPEYAHPGDAGLIFSPWKMPSLSPDVPAYSYRHCNRAAGGD